MNKIQSIAITTIFVVSISISFFITSDSKALASTNIFDTSKYNFDFIQNIIESKTNENSKCDYQDFIDTSDSLYKNAIKYVGERCYMSDTIQKNKFYPQNRVRRIDLINALAKTYSKYFVNETKSVEIRFRNDVDPKSKNYPNIQITEYMGALDLLVGKKTKYLEPNAFVSEADVNRIIAFLSAIKGEIKDDGLVVLDNSSHITRGKLAFVIANSISDINLNTTTENLIQSTTEDLIQNKVISSFDLREYNPMGIVNRYNIIDYTTKARILANTKNTPFGVSDAKYFIDVQEGNTKSIITQAKNLGLTNFWETKDGDKLYLYPNKPVSNYEAIEYLNSINSKKIEYSDQDKITALTFAKLSYYMGISFGRSKAENTVSKILGIRSRINNLLGI